MEREGEPSEGSSQIAAALHESEERYCRLLELSPVAIAIHQQGILVYVNPAGVRLVGARSAADLIGRPMLDFVHPDYRALVIDRARQVQEHGLAASALEEKFVRLDGQIIDVEVVSIPALYQGHPAAQVIVRDVTEQRRAEAAARREEEQIRLIVQASGMLLSTLDPDRVLGQILALAQRHVAADAYAVWRHLTEKGQWQAVASAGLSEEYRAASIAAMNHATPMSDAPLVVEDLDREPLLAPHREVHRRQGTQALLVVPLRIHGAAAGTLAFYFYQPHHFAEDEVRVATALANLAGAAMGTSDLYAEQARLRDEAEAAVRVREDVIALASHDLRHPLTAIDGTTQYLQQYLRRARSLDPDPIKRALDRIGESTARMTAMLADLVNAGRLQAGRPVELQLQPVDLVALVRGIVETQHAPTPRHEIQMEAGVPELTGQWDPRRLERVVANLLANAIKYSPEGGPIHVWVEPSTEGDAPAAVLRIEDRGIGIPVEDQPRIFERFYRGANVRGRFEGAGLGLAGVRQIVEQLGGMITVESREGVGSTFTVRLPLAVAD